MEEETSYNIESKTNLKVMEVFKQEGAKGFFARWKQGIQKITPLQQTREQVRFTWIVMIGIICGMVMTIRSWSSMWWVTIILVGALGNTYLSYVALKQKLNLLESLELNMGRLKEDGN